ncbi:MULTISPECIES: hypothetical protein [Streptomyces]|uniref:Uncharacterized protein n=1 Tax=Streptomyces physcomitrii TaxID=2724184 RepID=A0ABX1H352_9ACTN|nr:MULTISPECIES: hypothetical protein [Streptomyces]NKI41775.1 hypothetical protein [Streptomyces physcomitrii]
MTKRWRPPPPGNPDEPSIADEIGVFDPVPGCVRCESVLSVAERYWSEGDWVTWLALLTYGDRHQINKHGMDPTTGQVPEWHRREYRHTRTYIDPMP